MARMKIAKLLLGFWFVLVAMIAVGYALFERSWVPAYWEAEPLQPVAAQFGRSLVERMAHEGHEEVQWADVKALLAEERFVRLRDRSFVTSSEPDIVITIRLNDRFDVPIRKDGFALFLRR
jgi:hypothetical protein